MKVLFLDHVHSILEERLLQAGYVCDHHENTPRAEVLELVAQYEGIVIRSRMPMDEELLSAATSLRFIARSGAGMENIDLDAAAARKIVCFNAPEGNRDAVGEQALGMLLALMNHLLRADAEVRRMEWRREENRGHELGGRTVGIIGYGNNGSAFARKLRGFDVKVLAYDKYKTGFGDEYVTEATMPQLFAEADVLSFHIPQTEETLNLCDSAFLNHFHKPIYLLNLARGKIVNTEALADALDQEKVIGAGLDVLEYEKASFERLAQVPAPLQRLLDHPRVLFTPHVGGWTHESYFKLSDVLADKILAHFGSRD